MRACVHACARMCMCLVVVVVGGAGRGKGGGELHAHLYTTSVVLSPPPLTVPPPLAPHPSHIEL